MATSGPLSLTFSGPALGSFDGTPQDIRNYVDKTFTRTTGQPLQNTLQDILGDAQHYGVSMGQLSGAYGLNADQGAMALYNHGVNPESSIYTPSYQDNFGAADQTQNAPTAAGSPAPTLSTGGIANFQDYINQQLSGGFDASGQYTGPTNMFASGKFDPSAASGGLPQEELLQKIAAAGEALGMTPEEQAAGLGGTYTPAQIQAFESNPNNTPAIGIDKSIFNTDEMFSRDPSAAPDYAAIYTPTQHFADGGSIPSWAQDIQQFGDLSNLPPDMWAQMQAYAAGGNYAPDTSWNYDGYRIAPEISRGAQDDSGSGNDTLEGFYAMHPGNEGQGELYGLYNPSGAYQGLRAVNGESNWSTFLSFLGAAFGIAALPVAAGGAFGGALPAAGVAGDAAGAALGANGAFLGEGVASGIPAWDAALSGATAGGVGAGGVGISGLESNAGYGGLDAASTTSMGGGASIDGGAALGSGSSVFNAAHDSQLANEQLGLGPVTDMTGPAIPVNGPTGVTPGSGLGTGSGSGTGTGTGTGTGSGLNLSNSDWLKLISGLGSLTGGGSPSSTPAPAPAPSVDANYSYSVPGWRSDRPMYVPGQDEIPEGWFGAGHTS